ncbi:hypothetical protein UFOVP1244_28 [uncultured Caudovirales phage]|uniref:Uncharacterized protein n=1 Tax=uncultured Caudovirales phage TaxID=2100421 RepID=A0A6J5R6D0_9CAUD|nr:hypothetical protein UFOVP1244_28 [uncultured Caudovirales phage]
MLTVTSSLVANLQVQRNKGLNTAFCLYNFKKTGVTTSASTYIQMVPLPNGARILDLWVRNDNLNTGAFSVGDSSLTTRFVTATSLAATLLTRMNNPLGVGYRVSLTASDENSFDTIDISFAGATSDSASGCIAMCVHYIID